MNNYPREARIGNLTISPPWGNASGFLATPPAQARFAGYRTGFVTAKTILPPETPGHQTPIFVEGPDGFFYNAVGLAGPGVDGYADEMEGFYPLRVPLVVSVAGKQSEDEVRDVIGRLRGLYDAVELNVSCPNVKGGMAAGTNPQLTAVYTRVAKEEAGRKPVVVKLTPNVDGIATIALAAADAGADGVLAINTILGKYVNPHTLRPHLTNQTGGMSGHNIIDDGLRRVNEIASALDARGHKIAVGGVGGIRNAHDAKRYMAAGATYVQLGTCFFIDSPMEKKRFTEPDLETVEEKLTRLEREMYGNGTAI